MLEDKKGKMIEGSEKEDISKTPTLSLIIYMRFLLRESPIMNSFVYRMKGNSKRTILMSELLDELEYRFSERD